MDKSIRYLALAALLLPLAACGDATLTVKLVDAPGYPEVTAIYVDLVRVDVVQKGSPEEKAPKDGIKGGSGVYTAWESAVPMGVNLLDLTNGNFAALGAVDLDPGDYLQLRLVVGPDSTIRFTNDSMLYPLATPSGGSSGIKIKGTGAAPLFSVDRGEDVELVFDLNAALSLKPPGNREQRSGWKLDPVIKALTIKGVTLDTNQFVTEK